MALTREQVVQAAEKYVARGKIELAIREYRKLLAENPNHIDTLNRIGDLYARIQRIDEAVDFFTQIAEQYTAEEFFIKAIAFYKKIIRLDPTRLEAYEQLAELYHKQGLVNEARTQYQILADYYVKHQNATSAITIYQKMVQIEPENPIYHVRLAEIYHQQKLIEKEMGEFHIIAELMIQHGRLDDAAQVYEHALKIDSQNLGFIEDAARKLRQAGNAEGAARFLAAATERNPRAELAKSAEVPRPASESTQGGSDASSATIPPRPEQSSLPIAVQKTPGGKSRSSRDYAGELETLAQMFLPRKTITPPVNPATPRVIKDESGKAQASRWKSGAAGGIFICYRRSDSMDVSGRMYDRLVAHYSHGRVFKDVDSIPFGVDFRKHLEDAVAQASVFVVVIGRSWLRGRGVTRVKSGNSLLSHRDFVRIEIELALRMDLPIIPVLVGGAKMPSEKDLPESLVDLTYRNGMELRPDPNFHKDMDRLIAGMDAILNAKKLSG